jgi:hypothetical protein
VIRRLLLGLALLHLGPGAAFALLAFGCDGSVAALGGRVCGRAELAAFAWLTLLAWLLMGLGLAALHLLRRARAAPPPGTGARLAALGALLALGSLVAAAGIWLGGSQLWVLTLPAALAAGWLMLANPQACAPGAGRPGAEAHSPSLNRNDRAWPPSP